jgi:uncharacterized PurR-regulated membrane protein YhhQ (DUF165 family)
MLKTNDAAVGAGTESKILTATITSNSPVYTMIVGGYVAVIVISVGAAAKFISVGPWTLSGATLIWPLTFVFNDIFSEVYGYERSRRIIWTGMAVQVLTAFAY